MQNSGGPNEWQVTCVCGWRTHGAKDDVVSAVISHGKSTHDQELTAEQAFSQATPVAGE